jgi:hypothetical protein
MYDAQTVDKAPPPAPRRTSRMAELPEPSTFLSWESLGLDRGNNGQPYPTEANALRILQGHGNYSTRIWLDEFAQRLMLDEEPFQRHHAIEILVAMQTELRLPKMSLAAVERAAILAAQRNRRHPLRDFLRSLDWDGIDRLTTLLPDIWGTPQDHYHAAVGRCWLVSMVARVLNPGCKVDTMPVFEGAQGIRKSTALAMIAGQWFLETNENPVKNRKDFLLSLQGKWLVEIPEIDRIGGRHGSLEDLTGMITIRTDSYRVPYGQATQDFPRQCVFAGTTNRDEWNPDPTGGRRFWPVRCGAIDLEKLRIHRDQLLAEAVHRFDRGEAWHDVPVEFAREEQELRRQRDEWEDLIERFVTHRPDRQTPGRTYWEERAAPLVDLSVSDLLGDCLDLPAGRWDRSAQMRVANCLKALGYRRIRVSVGGSRSWTYRRYEP